MEEAALKGIGIHQLLTEKAARQRVGESGLVALDWWNGNRFDARRYEFDGCPPRSDIAHKAGRHLPGID